MKTIVSIAAFVLWLAACTEAQVAYVLSANGPFGLSGGAYLPTSGYPTGGLDIRGPLAVPNFGTFGAAFNPLPAGGHAIDQIRGAVYCSDGAILTMENHTLYTAAGGPPAVPVFGLLAGGGPISGIGCNSALNGFLYLCDGISFQARMKMFPFAPAGPVIVPAFPHAPFSGLGYDPSSNTLWLCDVTGAIYHVTLAGLPIGPQPVAVAFSAPGLPMIGLDVNTTDNTAAFPEPLCSTALPGYQVIVSDGFAVYDALNPFNPFIPVSTAAGGALGGYGVAFSADSQDMGGAGFSPSAGGFLNNRLNRPAVVGPIPGSATAIECTGLVPFGLATLWIDLCPVLGGIPLPPAGVLFINPFSPPISGSAIANGSGVASIAIPLAFAPPNVTFACQWFAPDPLNAPIFVALSNAMVVTSGL